MNWERRLPNGIPSPRESSPMRNVSPKNSQAVVRCSMPRMVCMANSCCFCRIIYRLTYRMRKSRSSVTPQMASFIHSLRKERSNSAPRAGW